ncbi:MAG: nedA [Phycisphaerales bacterium]|nr:nedA [Phycisphaerales bacterium]
MSMARRPVPPRTGAPAGFSLTLVAVVAFVAVTYNPTTGAAYAATPPATTPSAPEKVPVFSPTDLGFVSCRIPGLVVTDKGTLVAYCEARRGKGGDWDPTEILVRRSGDGGRTWDGPSRLAGGADGDRRTYNNPLAIADPAGGIVHFLYCVDYARCYYRRSGDDGRTFSAPVDITPTFDAFRPEYDWNVIATGPTHGVRLSTGRLLVPVWLSTGGKKHHPSAVATVYSDDAGKTWRRGEIAIRSTAEVPYPNETVAVELSDGRVMLNARNEAARQRRVVTTSQDGATGWTAPAFDDALVEPVCNASIVRLPDPAAPGRGQLVFANPDSLEPRSAKPLAPGQRKVSKRQNLTLRLSEDDGKTWTASRTLEPGPAAYSDLGAGTDGTIYCLYEVDGGLTIARVTAAWVAEDRRSSSGPAGR